MVEMTIREEACRGCRMCVDICPTDVVDFDESAMKAKVVNAKDCIACLSCAYLCPSSAISHGDFHVVKNFYRDLELGLKFARFL